MSVATDGEGPVVTDEEATRARVAKAVAARDAAIAEVAVLSAILKEPMAEPAIQPAGEPVAQPAGEPVAQLAVDAVRGDGGGKRGGGHSSRWYRRQHFRRQRGRLGGKYVFNFV